MTDKTDRTHVLNRIGKEEIQSLAQKIWQSENKVNMEIALEALAIIHEKYETDPTFFSGKSVKGIMGGLFYLLGQRHGNIRTQRQIATSLNTTEMTIRGSYRAWTEPIQNRYRHIHISKPSLNESKNENSSLKNAESGRTAGCRMKRRKN